MDSELRPIPLTDGYADTLRGVVRRGDVEARLTDIERRLLRYLHDHAGEALSRERLHVDVWEYAPTVRSRAADHTVARLRAKIEVDPAQPKLLHTVHGVGYRWVPGAAVGPSPTRGPGRGLVGRDDDMASLQAAVAVHRHVAVVGPVGVGTSALAATLGWRTIDLSAATRLEEVRQRVAGALGVPARADLCAADLAVALHSKGPVVLDDAEVDLGPLLADWPEAELVVTSRCRQAGVGQTLLVEPLPEALAVELLRREVEAAGAAAPGWADEARLASVAARADGLPLALEVLAAQATWLAPEQLLAQLQEAPQRVLRGAGGWVQAVAGAVDVLDPAQRQLLEHVSVFTAAPLEAVVELGSLSALRALVERSLLWPEPVPGRLRYRVLRPVADVVRALSADELAAARAAHAAWVCGEAFARAEHPCHDVTDPTWWRAHLPELVAAARHAPEPADRARLALCLVRLASFAWLPSPLPWLDAAVRDAERAGDRALQCAARALRGRFDPADPEGDLAAAGALATDPREVAMVCHHRALRAVDRRQYERARALSEEAYERFMACDCPRGAVDTLFPLVDALHATGRGVQAAEASTRAIRLARSLDDLRGLGIAYATRGYAAETFADTLADQQRALDVLETVHDINAAVRIRLGRARLQAMAGYPSEDLDELVAWADVLGQRRLAERARLEAAAAALHRGEPERMAAWLVGLEAAAERDGFSMLFGCLAVAQGDVERGYRRLKAAAGDEATAHPATGFFYAVAALVSDSPGRWRPALQRWTELVEATGRFSPFRRFVGLYTQLGLAFRAAVCTVEGDRQAAEEALAAAEAVPDPLPLWTAQRPAWRALVAGDELPRVADTPEGWVLRAMAARR